MSRVQKLRVFVNQRLNAAVEDIFGVFEKTITKYEQEAALSQEVIARQHALLCAVLKPQMQLPTVDAFTKQLLVSKEEVPPDQQQWSPSLDQEDPEPPHIKEEQEELWTSQEGEQLQGLEEVDIIKFTYNPRCVESRAQDWTEPSLLRQTQNLEGDPPLASTSSQQTRTGADGEDCGGPEPASNLDPASDLQPTSDCQLLSSHSSETETEDSDDYSKDTRTQLGSNTPKSKKRHKKEGQSFGCKVCGRSFQAKGFLMMHVNVHSDDPECVCGLCGERLEATESLKLHLQTHRKNRRKCDICGRDFPSRQCLENHMRTHTGERPFLCQICSRAFHQRSHLATHIKLHTGEKPYRCSDCGKSFIQLSNKRRHKCRPRMTNQHGNQEHRHSRQGETLQ